jgi:hypothetical protein
MSRLAILGAVAVSAIVSGVVSVALGAGGPPRPKLPENVVVNRTLKGDRLTANVTVLRKRTEPRELLDGCDALVSPLADEAISRRPGRCAT